MSVGVPSVHAGAWYTYLPNIVYFPSNEGCFAYVMKNYSHVSYLCIEWSARLTCDLLVSGPPLAMANIPRALNCTNVLAISPEGREDRRKVYGVVYG